MQDGFKKAIGDLLFGFNFSDRNDSNAVVSFQACVRRYQRIRFSFEEPGLCWIIHIGAGGSDNPIAADEHSLCYITHI